MRFCSFGLILARLALCSSVIFPSCANSAAGEELDHNPAIVKVMTFNIRYGSADDGAFSWSARRQHVENMIRRERPDVLAIQEGLAFQLEQLEPVLRMYNKYGQHRDGGLGGEFSGLYVHKDSAPVIVWGELWLSPTPDQVASRGWDAALPRMAVWVDLQLAEGTDRPPLPDAGVVRIYGTHFDHRGEEARLQSAKLLITHAAAGPPALFMGDFNAIESSAPIQEFVAASYQSAVATCDPTNTLGTFNGFKQADGGRRIDHMLYAPDFRPLAATILDDCFDGIWPSDHFPVTASLQLEIPR